MNVEIKVFLPLSGIHNHIHRRTNCLSFLHLAKPWAIALLDTLWFYFFKVHLEVRDTWNKQIIGIYHCYSYSVDICLNKNLTAWIRVLSDEIWLTSKDKFVPIVLHAPRGHNCKLWHTRGQKKKKDNSFFHHLVQKGSANFDFLWHVSFSFWNKVAFKILFWHLRKITKLKFKWVFIRMG